MFSPILFIEICCDCGSHEVEKLGCIDGKEAVIGQCLYNIIQERIPNAVERGGRKSPGSLKAEALRSLE